MHDAGSSDSVPTAPRFDLSDEQLSAELKKWTGTTPALHPVGELLDRHWEAAFAYARLCTDGPRAAGMLTTAAFTRLFGESLRQAGPSAAWRPHLLVTVRRIAAEWDGDGRQELLHPALRPDAAAGERAAARLLPPSGRRLLSRAFQRLSQSSRAVLWHAEVEADPLAVPAALLGLDEEETRIELRRARERLREECLQAHRELAPEAECQQYLRMLDVTFRRGGVDIDPDLQQHLARCRHCRLTADQLARFNGGLGLALAEAVLGWGARGYLESRAARTEQTPAPQPAPPTASVPSGGEAFTSMAPAPATTGPGSSAAPGRPASSRRSAHRAARRVRRRNLALAVVTVTGLVVLPLVLWSLLDSGDHPAPSPKDTASRAPGKDSVKPGPSWAAASGTAEGALHGRLHNLASGLCVGVVGDKAVHGAETELTSCTSTASQQWTYETDGLLRNSSAPDLCLDSHLGFSVRLAPCSATGKAAKDIRYDFTLQGALVPRSNQDLALTPAATDGSGALVLKNRSATSAQRWTVDTAKPDLQMEVVNWDTGTASSSAPPSKAAPKAAKTPSPTPTPKASESSPAPSPSATADFCAVHPDYCGWGDGGYGGGRGGRRR
ncbi:DNA-directed RNA polymerase specialized sigma24 family protein [Streptomyces griseochromogenes]|uniref:DNA-directed RNA polymerase specialized sigma24 family protein n=1 Tax=Streptomyces griseochromogenes TaxID=68214 RepID=A0A1B1AXD1_9ACTN|nr:RICIN domain-containing protein [Streptomyces griseochromogenes]ANP51172.1 hydrolase [Streptomyces griseochromogenes]MBP2050157.1 DNA-directed RNA polymerase specialized sigma24 family protein [Streptomyces griseochromogenes]